MKNFILLFISVFLVVSCTQDESLNLNKNESIVKSKNILKFDNGEVKYESNYVIHSSYETYGETVDCYGGNEETDDVLDPSLTYNQANDNYTFSWNDNFYRINCDNYEDIIVFYYNVDNPNDININGPAKSYCLKNSTVVYPTRVDIYNMNFGSVTVSFPNMPSCFWYKIITSRYSDDIYNPPNVFDPPFNEPINLCDVVSCYSETEWHYFHI